MRFWAEFLLVTVFSRVKSMACVHLRRGVVSSGLVDAFTGLFYEVILLNYWTKVFLRRIFSWH